MELRTLRRRGLAAAGLVCLALDGVPAGAQQVGEYDVKAAYLFNFGKYLRQPDTAEVHQRRSFDICVLGKDDFHGALDRVIANEQYAGLPERRLKVSNAAAARSCAIVFVSRSETDRVDQVMAELAGAAVLTVSDMPRFLQHGGMIQLEMQANHVRFSVALDPVNKVGLGLSSQLLKVALSVTGAPKRDEL